MLKNSPKPKPSLPPGEFAVVGFPRDRLNAAVARREARIAAVTLRREQAKADGKRLPRLPRPLDSDQYIATHKPTAYCRTFASRQAASDVVDLLCRHGWIAVRLVEPEGVPR